MKHHVNQRLVASNLFASVVTALAVGMALGAGLNPIITLVGGLISAFSLYIAAIEIVSPTGPIKMPDVPPIAKVCRNCVYFCPDPYRYKAPVCNAFHVPDPDLRDCPDFEPRLKRVHFLDDIR